MQDLRLFGLRTRDIKLRVGSGCERHPCSLTGCLLQETDEHGFKPGYLFKQFLRSLGNLGAWNTVWLGSSQGVWHRGWHGLLMVMQ